MTQRVEFESIPSTRYDQYIFKIKLLLGHLTGPEGTNFRPFRDFTRKQGMWDRERAPIMLGLLDISYDKKVVKIGKFAKKLAAIRSDDEIKAALFEHLKSENILLVKYVMEALDVESGGRLHSVHELYRMVTSYVYPGSYITLTAFQAFMDWLAATAFIKLVGIRWALSETGLKALVELKGMDIEEILEDLEEEEAEAAADDEDDDEDDDTETGDGGSGDVELDDEEDLFADLPPEPEPPSAEEIAAATASFGNAFEDVPGTGDALPPISAKKARASGRASAKSSRHAAPAPAPAPMAAGRAGIHAPLASMGWPSVATVSLDDADTAALAMKINGWFMALGDWPRFTGPELGVVHDEKAGDLALLVELGVLAALIEGLSPQPQVFAFVKRLRNSTFFATLGHGEGLEDCLDAMEKTGAEPWARSLFERLVHARFTARRVGMKIDLMMQLKSAESGAAIVDLVREHLTGKHWVEAPFWVIRELVRLGVLTGEHAESVCAVPTARLRRNAARIGLVPSAEIYDAAGLVALSQAVSKLFGAAGDYGASLEALDRGLGLSLD